MKEKRVKCFIVPDDQMLEILAGKSRVINLPEGATCGPVNFDWSRNSFAIQVQHESFPIVLEGCFLEVEYAVFERIELAKDDAGNLIGYRDG